MNACNSKYRLLRWMVQSPVCRRYEETPSNAENQRRNARNDGEPRRRPTGAAFLQRFEPRPPASLGPGIETRHPYRSQSRRHDALLARQKRGVAAAQPRNHHRSRDRHPLPKRTNLRCLRGVFRRQTGRIFQKRNAVGIYPTGSDFAEEDFLFSIHRRTKSQDSRESHCNKPMIPAKASNAPHHGN